MPRKKREQSPLPGFSAGETNEGRKDWTTVDPTVVGELVHAASSNNVAVMFGHSRDFGAVCVIAFWGDQKETIWPKYGQSAEELCILLAEHFSSYGTG